MKLVKYFEFNQQDLEPIKSFYIKDELNPKLWDEFKLEDEIFNKSLKYLVEMDYILLNENNEYNKII